MIEPPTTSATPADTAAPACCPRRQQQADHVISFDVEEYFQVEAAAAFVRPADWANYPSRVEKSIDLVLEILADAGVSATFFVLGSVARDHGPMVARIAGAGHEIASHGMSHRMLTRMSPEEFSAELSESRKLLEDLAGQRILGFRAPTFSIVRQTGVWAIDALAEAGFEYDSSVFPVHHDRYGIPDAPRWAHWAVGPGGGRVLEAPPLTLRVLGTNVPVGGGGYFRLLPACFVRRALGLAGRAGQTGVIYLHPWELDPDQPAVPMTRMGRWRHRVNLHKTASKLRRLLCRYSFGSFAENLESLKADARTEYRMSKPRD